MWYQRQNQEKIAQHRELINEILKETYRNQNGGLLSYAAYQFS